MPETFYSDANGRGATPVIPIANGGGPATVSLANSGSTNLLGDPGLSTSFGTATKANAKGTSGLVFSIEMSNVNAAIRYLQIHNKATAPVATDVPLYSIPIPAGTATAPAIVILGSDFFGLGGKTLSLGVGWAISTTVATFTDSATAADHTVHLHYV